MKTAKQIKAGCGKVWTDEGDSMGNGNTCGRNPEVIDCSKKGMPHHIKLCPTCQAKLIQYKSDLQQELEFLTYLKDDLICLLQKGDKVVEERINLIKKELEDAT